MGHRCTGTTAAGQPCKAWAVRTSNPPLCIAHGNTRRGPGAPPGNQNAVTHGLYAQADQETTGILAQIEDLDNRIKRLGEYIDLHEAELHIDVYCRLLDLHSKMMGRVTRMRQALKRMGQAENSELFDAINEALDDLAEEQGLIL